MIPKSKIDGYSSGIAVAVPRPWSLRRHGLGHCGLIGGPGASACHGLPWPAPYPAWSTFTKNDGKSACF